MVSLVDTSVLVAGVIVSHVHHRPSLTLLQKIHSKKLKAVICQHSLAEFYSILTSYPMTPPISPAAALSLIEENLLRSFPIIELGIQDYKNAIQRVRSLDLRSGSIYDALIFQAALKKKVKLLYTWNVRDFERLRSSTSEMEIVEPH